MMVIASVFKMRVNDGEEKMYVFRCPSYREKHKWLCALKKAGTPGA